MDAAFISLHVSLHPPFCYFFVISFKDEMLDEDLHQSTQRVAALRDSSCGSEQPTAARLLWEYKREQMWTCVRRVLESGVGGVRGAEHMDSQRLDGGGEGYGMP